MKAFQSFCARLGAAIQASGLTRAELAQRLDVQPATIKSWVVGRRSPTVRRLLDLTAVLGIEPGSLFEECPLLPEPVACTVCGQAFSRRLGLRIHLGLKAKDCAEHARAHGPARQAGASDASSERWASAQGGSSPTFAWTTGAPASLDGALR